MIDQQKISSQKVQAHWGQIYVFLEYNNRKKSRIKQQQNIIRENGRKHPAIGYTGRAMRTRVFGHMWTRICGHLRTAKAQIRLRIRAVWSGPSLSAKII